MEKLLAADPRTRGRVLDAGTGGGFMTALLAGLRPERLVSVSLDEAAFEAARGRLPGDSATRVSFIMGDLADSGFLRGERFDLIVGDYLLASVAGHRPFREIDVIARLRDLLAPGGLLILTGSEPFEPYQRPEQEAVRRVMRWREAMVHLAGEESYREYPAWWVVARLSEQGLEAEEPRHSDPVTWSLAHLRKLAESGAARAAASGDSRLAAFTRRRLEAICREAARLPGFAPGGGPVTWGKDWVVLARPRT